MNIELCIGPCLDGKRWLTLIPNQILEGRKDILCYDNGTQEVKGIILTNKDVDDLILWLTSKAKEIEE